MNSPAISLSIIVCSRNRSTELRLYLPELIRQAQIFDDVEVIVIDNGSTDNTVETVNQLNLQFNKFVRYVYEPIAGLCRARNRGSLEAKGEILVYIDDDAVPHEGWVAALREVFERTNCDSVGGPIIAKPRGGKPEWFTKSLLWVIGEYNKGDVERDYDLPSDCPAGGNFGVKKIVFDSVKGFDERLKLYNDEVDFFRRLKERGFNSVYCPQIIVDHCPVLTKKGLLDKAINLGKSTAIISILKKESLGQQTKQFVVRTFLLVYLGTRWLFGGKFDHAFTFWMNWGGIIGLLKRKF